MERRIFTINTNYPAVKLTVVQTVVLWARVLWLGTEQTASGSWGDIRWIWQKVSWIRIAVHNFKRNLRNNIKFSELFSCNYYLWPQCSLFSKSLVLSPVRPSDSGKHSLYNCVCFAHTQEIQQLPHASETDIQMAAGRDIWLWKQWDEEESGMCGFVVSVHQNIAWPFSRDILHAVCIPLTFQTVGGKDASLYWGWCLVFTLTVTHHTQTFILCTPWNVAGQIVPTSLCNFVTG